jgi:HK97 family phage major capsid protein
MTPPNPQTQRKAAADRVLEAKKIQQTADAENKPLTKEEEEKIFALIQEAEALQHDAERREKLEAAVADVERVAPRLTTSVGPDHHPSSIIVPTAPAEARDTDLEKRHGFSTLGEFAQHVRQAMDPYIGIRDKRLDFYSAVTGMSTKAGGDGGFLLPPAFNTAVWDGMNSDPGNLVALTESYPVDGESLTLNANAETSRATGSRFGGVRGYWLGEGEQITSSKATFRQIRGEPHDIAAMCYVTDKLLANASALERYLQNAITRELIFLMNDALINGDGANKPLGILNASCTVSQAKETGQAVDTVMFENCVKMFSRLHPECRANGKWFINLEVEPQLQQMTLGVGAGGVPAYMPPGGLSQQPYGTLFGRPVMPIEFCAKLGDVGDIILADFSKYVTFTRGGIASNSSIHLRFDYNETAFRWITALDGQPWLASAITPYKATSGLTLSSFVTLAAR